MDVCPKGENLKQEPLERIADSLEAILSLLQKKKAPKKEFCMDACKQMWEVWNIFKDNKLPKILDINASSTRGRNASARWLERPEREYWTNVVIGINNSKFCLGDNDRGWLADFEFFVRPDTHLKILEGKYDNLHKTRTAEPKATRVVTYLADGTPVVSAK